ncbi:aminoglycoside phosphotransferase [Amycolatopsis rubida]|uniref:Streptomycin 6-kinase n=1 Tax=Amycolatopsis rubida TaxID=112413 RepID=A0A1I6AEP7_9PSEU|nr:aminoglycoside phosphotransferase family protein [Amycolatopsis rubida]MYW92328.1 aminoglycoside phosphotransferase [Amycolatopsis rubida]OAP23808.1 Aminoglycoside/hydroxyurea antibiotic resistance kinase [Amycolatopsis sp. M39]SFQ67017.1 streptomycin 6-kinase [Amycolatopsis rubida]
MSVVTVLVIPPFFAERAPKVLGPEAVPWLASLPSLAQRYARKWELEFEDTARHGYVGVVQPARRADGSRVVLKLGWVEEESRDEPLALSTWAGRGSVLLHESVPEDGAMLLERLDDSRTLDGEPLLPAVEIMSELARRLAVPAPAGLTRTLSAVAEELLEELPKSWRELDEPLPRRELDAALEVCRDLGPAAGNALVNEDLHYENVLSGTREPWLVIDPKPLAGDLEYGALSLLWNRFSESTLDSKLAASGLDRDRAKAWTLVRAVQNRLWHAQDLVDFGGLPEDDDGPSADALPVLTRWAIAG